MTPERTLPSHFICPLTHEIMHDPVFTKYGQSFERKAILSWLDTVGGVCPLTKKALKLHDIITNCSLKAEIDDFLSSSHDSSFEDDDEEEEGYLPHLPTARDRTVSIQSISEDPFIAPPLPQRVSSSRMSQNSSLDTEDLAALLSGNMSMASSSYRDSHHHHDGRRISSSKSSLPATKAHRLSLGLSSIAYRMGQPLKGRANAA